ncbi:MAG: DUF4038 domain-containing protein [Verrucomicrobia bacterium]|nr:DUF4038 domain-containing protein [Verrucomicrobiota bacterium]
MASGPFSTARAADRLKVSDNKRFLVHEDNRPFFYLGDTAWELFHCLTREEADLYLRTRAEQTFTVIQAVVLAEFDGLRMPNAYGHVPLRNDDPTQPVEEYFQHVDWITRRANELGLWVGMLPTWGDKWSKRWGKGPLIFTPQNARAYGEWLARRYRDAKITWILGGDRAIENDGQREIIRAMAAGLRAGDGGAHLITYHPSGGKHSADMVHDEPWLDFNMIQSGHGEKNIWSFHDPVKKRRFVDQRTAWQEAIHLPGANQMRHARALMESRPFLTRIPDQSVIAGDAGTGADHLQATRDAQGSYAMVYSPSGKPFKVRMDKIAGAKVKASWFNPRNGEASAIGDFTNTGEREFTPPTSGENNDWVLVLDDAAKDFRPPGTRVDK